MDLFTLLSSSKRRYQSFIKFSADKLQKSEKTIKRIHEGSKINFDLNYWKVHGEMKEEDWNNVINNLYETQRRLSPHNSKQFKFPDEYRQIFPGYLDFLVVITSFKLCFEKENDKSPLLVPAIDYLVRQTIANSNVMHSLMSNNKDEYEKDITKILFPFSIPDQEIWNSRDDTDFLEQKFMELGKLGILTFALCLDIGLLGWLYPQLKERNSDSMLLSIFLKYDKTIPRREEFFQIYKDKLCAEKNVENKINNFYKLLIGENINDSDERIDAIRKLCTSIRRNKLPTSKTLNEFIEKVYKAKGEQCEFKTEQERSNNFISVRTQYALIILVDDLYQEFCVKGNKELSTLISELQEYRSWLYKNVFDCPIPIVK